VLCIGIAASARNGSLMGDFRAFYCAGSVVIHGGDPYLAAPLSRCETSPQPFSLYQARDGVVLPAPLPGYALLPFIALSFIPFPFACLVWFAILLGACAIAWRSLTYLINDRLEAVVLAAALPLAVSTPFGEIIPIAVAAFCACGAALKRSAPGAAVAWATLAMMQPHVGLPVMVALMGWERTRWRAVFAVACLAVLHVAVVRHEALGYFTHLLPQHALAELPRASQFSVAWIAQALGASPQIALAVGTCSYALALVGGVSVAAFLAWRTRSPELLALVPPAFALLGGTFIHLAQMLVALPAVLVMIPHAHGRNRVLLASALVLLAIPWNVASVVVWMSPLVALVAGGITLVTLRQPSIVALRVALACVVYFGIVAVARAWIPLTPPSPLVPTFDPSLAPASWGWWIHMHDSDASLGTWLAKVPTWTGLMLFAFASISVAREQRITVVTEHDAPAAVGS
jgi:hypothetical protein